MSFFRKLTSILAAVSLLAACGGGDGDSGGGAGSGDGSGTAKPALVSISISPDNAAIPLGLAHPLAAIASYSDGSTQDVTNSAEWIVDSAEHAAIESIGPDSQLHLVTKAEGSTQVIASYSEGDVKVSSSAKIDIIRKTISTIQVTPTKTVIPVGLTEPFIATAVFTDGTTQDITRDPITSWSVSPVGIATIDTNTGIATGIKPGVATVSVSATLDGNNYSSTAELEVSDAVIVGLQITPVNASIPVGLSQEFTATAIASDGSVHRGVISPTDINWKTSDSTVATISNTGTATGVKVGNVTISATININGVMLTTSSQVHVSDAEIASIQVTPAVKSLPSGVEQQYIATAMMTDGSAVDVTNHESVSWVSSNPGVATIDLNGLVKAVASGDSQIRATLAIGPAVYSANAHLQVTAAVPSTLNIVPADVAIPLGLEHAFRAMMTYSDGSMLDITNTHGLSWSSSDPSMLTIVSNQLSGNGVAKAVRQGNVTVQAVYNVDGRNMVAAAQATVTETVMTGLQVTPVSAAIAAGMPQQYTAIAMMSDGSTQNVTGSDAISWSSSDIEVATIGGKSGLAKGGKVGIATISAHMLVNGTAHNAQAQLQVTEAVITELQVTPVATTLPKGATQALIATAILSDGTTTIVTDDPSLSWSSSNPALVTIEKNGVATALEKGEVTITASMLVGSERTTAEATIMVSDAVLSALRIDPNTVSLALGMAYPFAAVATYSDGEVIDVSDMVNWRSSDMAIATITDGVATAVSAGTVTISAVLDDVEATAALTVTDAVVTAITLTPTTLTIPKGLSQQLTVMATYSDGTRRDITADASYQVRPDSVVVPIDSPEHVHIDAVSVNTSGMLKAENVGSATVTATFAANGKSYQSQARVTVSDAIVTALVVTPTAPALPAGRSQQLTAVATLSDGSVRDVTSDPSLSWVSNNTSIATVSNRGLLSGVTSGAAQVTVTKLEVARSISMIVPVSVTSAVLVSARFSHPENGNFIPTGLTERLEVIGTMSDGSELVLNDHLGLVWTTSDSSLMTVNKGLVTTHHNELSGHQWTTNGADINSSRPFAIGRISVNGVIDGVNINYGANFDVSTAVRLPGVGVFYVTFTKERGSDVWTPARLMAGMEQSGQHHHCRYGFANSRTVKPAELAAFVAKYPDTTGLMWPQADVWRYPLFVPNSYKSSDASSYTSITVGDINTGATRFANSSDLTDLGEIYGIVYTDEATLCIVPESTSATNYVSALNANAHVYGLYSETVTVEVKNETGSVVSGAEVNISRPSCSGDGCKISLPGSVTTGSDGKATFTYSGNSYYKGAFSILATHNATSKQVNVTLEPREPNRPTY
ncbi:Ig-like domain-containing protein [Aeromonas veronii]